MFIIALTIVFLYDYISFEREENYRMVELISRMHFDEMLHNLWMTFRRWRWHLSNDRKLTAVTSV